MPRRAGASAVLPTAGHSARPTPVRPALAPDPASAARGEPRFVLLIGLLVWWVCAGTTRFSANAWLTSRRRWT
jgi:hypothetical protein